jgi:hypothetical protein
VQTDDSRDLLNRTLEVRENFAQLIGSAEAGLRTEENPERKHRHGDHPTRHDSRAADG